jgi:hypothetical protein
MTMNRPAVLTPLIRPGSVSTEIAMASSGRELGADIRVRTVVALHDTMVVNAVTPIRPGTVNSRRHQVFVVFADAAGGVVVVVSGAGSGGVGVGSADGGSICDAIPGPSPAVQAIADRSPAGGYSLSATGQYAARDPRTPTERGAACERYRLLGGQAGPAQPLLDG